MEKPDFSKMSIDVLDTAKFMLRYHCVCWSVLGASLEKPNVKKIDVSNFILVIRQPLVLKLVANLEIGLNISVNRN